MVNVRQRNRPEPSTFATASVKTALQPVARERVRPAGNPTFSLVSHRTDEDESIRVFREYIDAKQIADPYNSAVAANIGPGGSLPIIEPPYNPFALIKLPQDNSVLGQCIAAMTTNMHGHGYGFEYIGPEGQQESSQAETEKTILQGLVDYPNDEYGTQEMGLRFSTDYETLGYGMLEVGRDLTSKITRISHIGAHTVRLTKKDDIAIPVEVMLPRDGKLTPVKVQKQFRRFVQRIGQKVVFFKEFGDPRIIDPKTGMENKDLRVEDAATEIIFVSQYNPNSPYGIPRWFNQLPAIMGSRQSELTNLDFFKDNAIPAMAVMVSGGQITQGSIDAIEQHLSAARGRAAMHRMLVIEAEGDSSQGSVEGSIPAPKLEIKPLLSERQGDALFQNYEANNRDKIRSSFRLPPLFIGLSSDYTYAVAQTSYEVAETQVFKPERNKFDSLMNLKILSTYNPKFWAYRSYPPKLSDPDALVKALQSFDAVGGLTPNIAIGLANKFYGLDTDPINEDWGDFPFPLVVAAFEAGKLELGLENQEPPAPPAPVNIGTGGDQAGTADLESKAPVKGTSSGGKKVTAKPKTPGKSGGKKTTTATSKGKGPGTTKKKVDHVHKVLMGVRDLLRNDEDDAQS